MPDPEPRGGTSILMIMMSSLGGLLILAINFMPIQMIVDWFVEFEKELFIQDPHMQASMSDIVFLGRSTYLIMNVAAICLFVLPIIWTIMRHRYKQQQVDNQLY